MPFNSVQYPLFLIAVVLLYYAITSRWRITLLLAASYYFYLSWKVEYLILILAATAISYLCARAIQGSFKTSHKKGFLFMAFAANLGILFAFKYWNFFSVAATSLIRSFGPYSALPELRVLLPVGISFYTFQSLGYVMDVYRGQRTEPSFLKYSLFVSFFPQLVAGPIERSRNLLPQFSRKYDFNPEKSFSGLQLIVWGLFKKMVIADRLAMLVDPVYGDVAHASSLYLIIATYAFAFQIYCDFSGYSDIAIGSARLLGIELMQNFRTPYFSASFTEFWKRWHISLSTWFRDYMYIPLGGNRVSASRWTGNILAVFVISGLWHGANWTFLAWGGLHGLCYLLERVLSWLVKGLPQFRGWLFGSGAGRILRIAIVFHTVTLLWVFFRAESIADAFTVFDGMFSILFQDAGSRLTKVPGGEMLMTVILVALLIILEAGETFLRLRNRLSALPLPIRWSVYLGGLALIPIFGVFHRRSEFIYFQF